MNLKKTMCSYLALLAAASFAETYTWHGEGEQPLPAGGAWGVAENWRNSSGGVASESPGAGDITLFVQPTKTVRSTYKVTFDGDCTVDTIQLKDMAPISTFDLRGHTLTATTGFYGAFTWDSTAGLMVTNGTFHAGTIEVGQASDRAYGGGGFRAVGPDAAIHVDGALKVTGCYSSLDVCDGASVSCAQFFGTSRVETDNGRCALTGEGTSMLVTNGTFIISDYFKFYVQDGARLTVSNSSARIQIGRYDTKHNTLMRVDNATFDVFGQDVTVGDADGATLKNCQLILTNNATMTMDKSLYLGRGHISAVMTDHTLTVANGSTLTGGVNSDIFAYGMNVDKVFFSGYNNINVLDGSVSVRNLKFGNLAKPVSSNGVLRVEGSRAKVALSGTAATALQLRMGVDLRITIPEAGFNATPIQIPNGGVTVLDDAENGAKQVDFFFDAGAYSRKHKGQPVTLIECGLDSAESLQRLADNVTYVNTPENLRGTLEVVDGTKLVYKPPRAPGLMLLLK